MTNYVKIIDQMVGVSSVREVGVSFLTPALEMFLDVKFDIVLNYQFVVKTMKR